MQKTKDTFYMKLRERLEEVSPSRTIAVNGTTRPAIVVDENESVSPEDTFRLSWGTCSTADAGSRLMKMDCTIRYTTRGADGTAGDRGRALGTLDAELLGITQPQRALQMDYAVIPAKSTGTMIFWTDLEFAAPKDDAGRMERAASTTVYFAAPEVTQ